MSRYKKYRAPFLDRNHAGEKICIMCGKPLTGRKQTWCGDPQCWQLQWIRSGDQSEMRRYLFEKEKGICQRCGTDCEMIREVAKWLLRHHIVDGRGKEIGTTSDTCLGLGMLSEFQKLGFPIKVTYHGLHTWEADHIVPLAEGGTHHEDNLQTLCIACHKQDTKELAGRLAKKRKDEKYGIVGTLFDKGNG